MARSDPWALAKVQFEHDRAVIDELACIRTEAGEDARRWLLAKKRAKMCESAFGFLRGSLAFFERALKAVRPIVADVAGEGWIVGDAHAENFGVLRVDRAAPFERGAVRHQVNDFDAVREGPIVDDVLRLCTSALLAGASRGEPAERNLQWIAAILDGYLTDERVEPPKPVRALIAKVEARTYEAFLAARTSVKKSESYRAHEFNRGERYLSLSRSEHRAIEAIGRDIAELYPKIAERAHGFYRVDDAAFRVAGNGSLGLFRAAICVTPIEPDEPPWLFDLKQCTVKQRSLLAARDALGATDAHPVVLRADGRTMMLRPLAPQEDKLSIHKVETAQFEALFRYLGSVLGEAHRGAQQSARVRWDRDARGAIEEATVVLVGVHQSAHMAYVALSRDERR